MRFIRKVPFHFIAVPVLLLIPFNGLAQVPVAAPVIPQNEFLLRSGVAFDASEDLLGIIHIEEPKSFFKPDTEQVSWWGEFKPFKTWGSPELTAEWHNPRGEVVARQEFKGSVCRLAKTTLSAAGLNLQQNQGQWRVNVYMKGELLDSKVFYIYGSQKAGAPQPKLTIQTPAAR